MRVCSLDWRLTVRRAKKRRNYSNATQPCQSLRLPRPSGRGLLRIDPEHVEGSSNCCTIWLPTLQAPCHRRRDRPIALLRSCEARESARPRRQTFPPQHIHRIATEERQGGSAYRFLTSQRDPSGPQLAEAFWNSFSRGLRSRCLSQFQLSLSLKPRWVPHASGEVRSWLHHPPLNWKGDRPLKDLSPFRFALLILAWLKVARDQATGWEPFAKR